MPEEKLTIEELRALSKEGKKSARKKLTKDLEKALRDAAKEGKTTIRIKYCPEVIQIALSMGLEVEEFPEADSMYLNW